MMVKRATSSRRRCECCTQLEHAASGAAVKERYKQPRIQSAKLNASCKLAERARSSPERDEATRSIDGSRQFRESFLRD